jgi:hypothetical protein
MKVITNIKLFIKLLIIAILQEICIKDSRDKNRSKFGFNQNKKINLKKYYIPSSLSKYS